MFFYPFLLHTIISCETVQYLNNFCIYDVIDRNKIKIIIVFLSYKLKNCAKQVCRRKDIEINTVIDIYRTNGNLDYL